MNAMDNPLLDFDGLPRFDAMRPAHIVPAIDALLGEARAAVERVAADPQPATWDRVVEPVADALDRLDRAWSAVRHLHAVVNEPELRDAYSASQPGVVAFFTDLAHDLRLYAKYRELRAAPSFASLEPSQQRLIDNELRDFKLGGAELSDDGKARLKALNAEAGRAFHAVRGTPARRDEHLGAFRRRRGGARRRAGRRDGRGARGGASRGQAGLEAHAAHALLPAGDAIRA